MFSTISKVTSKWRMNALLPETEQLTTDNRVLFLGKFTMLEQDGIAFQLDRDKTSPPLCEVALEHNC